MKKSKAVNVADGLKRGEERALGDSLYLRSQGGVPTFEVHFRWPGRNGKSIRRRYRIGTIETHPDVDANRITAIEVCKKARLGVDPELIRKAALTPTFGEHAEAFMERHLPTLKNHSSRAKWRGSLKNHCGPIWAKPIDQIGRREVLEVLEPIWRKIPVMASEVRARIEMILDDAAIGGLRPSEDNPAKWSKTWRHALGSAPARRGSVRGSMASIPFEELPALIAELRAKETQTARALLGVIMTCVRTQEFVAMRRSELDLDAEVPVWTIPYARLKVSPHRLDFVVPLAPQMIAVLKEQIAVLEEFGPLDCLWPAVIGGAQMSNATMIRYLQRSMGRKATVHGFRASFRTWADDQFLDGSEATPKYHRHAVESALAHNPGAAVESAYRRGMMLKARVAIMPDWADYLFAD